MPGREAVRTTPSTTPTSAAVRGSPAWLAAQRGRDPRIDRLELRTRNWPALAALWVLGSVWLALIVLIAAAGLLDVSIPEAVGWVLLAIAGVGFALALVGISLIRERGETAMAICALVLALSLPSLGSTFFFFGVFGGLGGGID